MPGQKTLSAMLLIALSAIWTPQLAAQERTAIPARVELYAVPTLTLSDTAFLTGDASAGDATVISGELRIAQGAGRLPVAVLMHGSGGISANIDVWSRLLNAKGVSTFVIDGFTGRGIVQTATDQARLGRLNFILDIYRSLEILAKHPRVDPDRIVLIGFSRGGQAALYAAMERFHGMWNRSGVGFAAYMPFYADCATRYIDDLKLVARPIRLIHGEDDDWNPLRICSAQADRLKQAGVDIAIFSYPGAHHVFDNPLSDELATVAPAQTVRNCSVEERSPGQTINVATGAQFSFADACVEKGPRMGGNPAARAAAQTAVMEYIMSVVGRKQN